MSLIIRRYSSRNSIIIKSNKHLKGDTCFTDDDTFLPVGEAPNEVAKKTPATVNQKKTRSIFPLFISH